LNAEGYTHPTKYQIVIAPAFVYQFIVGCVSEA